MRYLVFQFVYLGHDDVDDTAQHDDEVESVPCVSEVVLMMLQYNVFNADFGEIEKMKIVIAKTLDLG